MIYPQESFYNDADYLRLEQINKILTGRLAYSNLPRNRLKQLEVYAESFLNCSCCDKHEVANELAKLSWFITKAPELEIDSPPVTPVTPIDFGFLANTVGLHEPPGRRLRAEMKRVMTTKQRRLPPSLGQIIEDNDWWDYYEHQQDLEPTEPMRTLDFMWFHPIDIRHYVDCILREVEIVLCGMKPGDFQTH